MWASFPILVLGVVKKQRRHWHLITAQTGSCRREVHDFSPLLSPLTVALLMFKLHFIAIAPLRGKAGGPQKFNISKTFVSKWFQCSESPDWLGLYKRCRVVSGVWMEVPEAPVGERKCNQCRIALRWRTLKCASVGRGTSCSLPTSAPLPPSLPSFRSAFLFSSQSLFSPCESVPLFLFSLRTVACFIYSP